MIDIQIDTKCLLLWTHFFLYITIYVLIYFFLYYRIPLEQTVLDIKSYAQNESVEDFLFQLPEPPTKEAIDFAVNDLIDLGKILFSFYALVKLWNGEFFSI